MICSLYFTSSYNEKRIKEKLGWMSPIQYLLNTLAA
ncbi:IS3 family transposase [Ruminococcus sp.]